MLSIQVLCVGKLGEKFWAHANDEYIKRLSAYCKIEVIELPEQKLGDSPSDKQIEQALEKEAQLIRKRIASGATIVAMCIEGKMLSSTQLADKMNQMMCTGTGKMAILIGGSFGLDESLKQQADLRLSMSPMTFPHHFARIMLLEQIYRAFHILNGGKYHK